MDRNSYRQEIAELESYEAKAWREFLQARAAGLDEQANALHKRQQYWLDKIMKVHERWMGELVREDNANRRDSEGERAS